MSLTDKDGGRVHKQQTRNANVTNLATFVDRNETRLIIKTTISTTYAKNPDNNRMKFLKNIFKKRILNESLSIIPNC